MAAVRPIGSFEGCWTSKDMFMPVGPAGEFNAEVLYAELQSLEKKLGGPVPCRVVVEPLTRRRSLGQNALMWALIEVLAEHANGRPATKDDAQSMYMDLLGDFGCEAEYLQARREAVPALTRVFRVVQVMEQHDDGTVTLRCMQGTSGFTKDQMHQFIESIFDRLAKEGARDPRLARWRAEFYGEE